MRMRIVLTDVYREGSVFVRAELKFGSKDEVSGDKGENVVLARAGGREVSILGQL